LALLGAGTALSICTLGMARARASDVTVTVRDVRDDRGRVEVSLYADDGTWPNGAPRFHADLAAAAGTVTATFRGVPPGRYAISGFHDENDNHEFDTRFFLPREGFLFSGDVKPRLTAPAFDACAFDVADVDVTLSVHLQYWRSTRH